MSFIKLIERVNTLHRLIKNESTGTPEELAKKLGVSRASLYDLIDNLKSYDAPIKYSRSRETYYYTKEFRLDINYSITIIESEDELKKISGGCKLFSSVHFFRRKDDIFVDIS